MSDVSNLTHFLFLIDLKIDLLLSQPYSSVLNSYLQHDSFIGLVHHDLTFCDSMMFIPLSFKFNFDAVKIDIFLFSSQLFVYYFIFFRQKAATFQNNLYLCRCYLPMVAVMSSEEDGAAGWSTTY